MKLGLASSLGTSQFGTLYKERVVYFPEYPFGSEVSVQWLDIMPFGRPSMFRGLLRLLSVLTRQQELGMDKGNLSLFCKESSCSVSHY